VPFRDISGHRLIVELLSRSTARGTLPPSLIFAGPRGSGKRLTALAVAQALNCHSPIVTQAASSTDVPHLPLDACGQCAACTRIARGVHPDFVVVEPGDNGTIKVDEVRDVVERAAYRPFEGRRRVVVIEDADALVTAAQNALLKTLEEPPSGSVFVLLTVRPDVLLPTIRSRCIRLTFATASAPDVDEEAREVAQRVLTHAASTGSHDARRLEGAKDLLAHTGAGAAADREQVTAHLRAMASLLRDIAVRATRADTPLANEDLQASLDRLAPAYRRERAVDAFSAIDRAIEAVERNVGVKVVADWLVLQL
jgi:DNA polymerase-3 subunit delta'